MTELEFAVVESHSAGAAIYILDRGINLDMTDQKRAEDELKALTSSDGLMGLANRRIFDRVLDMEWSKFQRTRRPMSILIADVDHFKLFNNHHGHQRGDDCLVRSRLS